MSHGFPFLPSAASARTHVEENLVRYSAPRIHLDERPGVDVNVQISSILKTGLRNRVSDDRYGVRRRAVAFCLGQCFYEAVGPGWSCFAMKYGHPNIDLIFKRCSPHRDQR